MLYKNLLIWINIAKIIEECELFI